MDTNKPASSPAPANHSHMARKVLIVVLIVAAGGLGYLLWNGHLGVDISRFFAAPLGEEPTSAYMTNGLYPYRGGTPIAGGTYKIAWTEEDTRDMDTVNIVLTQDTKVVMMIAEDVGLSGFLRWRIPEDVSGEGYQVMFQDSTGRFGTAESPSNFSIVPSGGLVEIRPVSFPVKETYRPGTSDILVLSYEVINPHSAPIHFHKMDITMSDTIETDSGFFGEVTWSTSDGGVLGERTLARFPQGYPYYTSLSVPGTGLVDGPIGCLNDCPAVLTVPANSTVTVNVNADSDPDNINGTVHFFMDDENFMLTFNHLPMQWEALPLNGPDITLAGPPLIPTPAPPPPSCQPLPPCVYEGEPRCSLDPAPGVIFCPTPTIMPTITPEAVYRGVMIAFGNPKTITANVDTLIPLNIGRGLGAPIPDPYHVTGFETTVWIVEGDAQFLSYQNSTPFPDIIEEPVINDDGNQLKLALGVGTDRPPITIGNTPFGSVLVRATGLSERICLQVDQRLTRVSAVGIPGNVFDADNRGGWERVVCLNVDVTVVAGDANRDALVNIFDYNIVVSEFGRSGPDLAGDLTGDGKVDLFDYNLVVTNFGN